MAKLKHDHSSSVHKNAIPNKPGGRSNWIEQQGHLPAYIARVAKHIAADSHLPPGRAIAAAVSQCRKWAAQGNAEAAAAVAEWERMKAASKAKRGRKTSLSVHRAGALDLASYRAGQSFQHREGSGYSWKHGYIPLTAKTAKANRKKFRPELIAGKPKSETTPAKPAAKPAAKVAPKTAKPEAKTPAEAKPRHGKGDSFAFKGRRFAIDADEPTTDKEGKPAYWVRDVMTGQRMTATVSKADELIAESKPRTGGRLPIRPVGGDVKAKKGDAVIVSETSRNYAMGGGKSEETTRYRVGRVASATKDGKVKSVYFNESTYEGAGRPTDVTTRSHEVALLQGADADAAITATRTEETFPWTGESFDSLDDLETAIADKLKPATKPVRVARPKAGERFTFNGKQYEVMSTELVKDRPGHKSYQVRDVETGKTLRAEESQVRKLVAEQRPSEPAKPAAKAAPKTPKSEASPKRAPATVSVPAKPVVTGKRSRKVAAPRPVGGAKYGKGTTYGTGRDKRTIVSEGIVKDPDMPGTDFYRVRDAEGRERLAWAKSVNEQVENERKIEREQRRSIAAGQGRAAAAEPLLAGVARGRIAKAEAMERDRERKFRQAEARAREAEAAYKKTYNREDDAARKAAIEAAGDARIAYERAHRNAVYEQASMTALANLVTVGKVNGGAAHRQSVEAIKGALRNGWQVIPERGGGFTVIEPAGVEGRTRSVSFSFDDTGKINKAHDSNHNTISLKKAREVITGRPRTPMAQNRKAPSPEPAPAAPRPASPAPVARPQTAPVDQAEAERRFDVEQKLKRDFNKGISDDTYENRSRWIEAGPELRGLPGGARAYIADNGVTTTLHVKDGAYEWRQTDASGKQIASGTTHNVKEAMDTARQGRHVPAPKPLQIKAGEVFPTRGGVKWRAETGKKTSHDGREGYWMVHPDTGERKFAPADVIEDMAKKKRAKTGQR